jgi:hypothetical protein
MQQLTEQPGLAHGPASLLPVSQTPPTEQAVSAPRLVSFGLPERTASLCALASSRLGCLGLSEAGGAGGFVTSGHSVPSPSLSAGQSTRSQHDCCGSDLSTTHH